MLLSIYVKGDDFMASLTSAINIQIDSETKRKATDILNDLGLSMSTAINIFLRQVIKKDGLPFEVNNNNSNDDLLDAIEEIRDMINNPQNYPSYTNREDLKKALLKDD